MMQKINIIVLSCASITMLYNIHYMSSSIKKLKQQTYNSDKSQNIYKTSIVMMIIFLFGYVSFIAHVVAVQNHNMAHFLVVMVFLLSSIFILLMIRIQNAQLDAISNKTQELIHILVNTLEIKDSKNKGKSKLIQKVTEIFYNYLHIDTQKKVNKEKLLDAALLHDIAKITAPDKLLKEIKLANTEDKTAISQRAQAKTILESTSFDIISDIILYHQERVDGKGVYRLKKEEIPIESKIIAISKAFVDTCSEDYENAISYLKDKAGENFDIKLVSYFMTIPKEKLLNCIKS